MDSRNENQNLLDMAKTMPAQSDSLESPQKSRLTLARPSSAKPSKYRNPIHDELKNSTHPHIVSHICKMQYSDAIGASPRRPATTESFKRVDSTKKIAQQPKNIQATLTQRKEILHAHYLIQKRHGIESLDDLILTREKADHQRFYTQVCFLLFRTVKVF